jgi:DNA-binding MarR family transcriptional regulator
MKKQDVDKSNIEGSGAAVAAAALHSLVMGATRRVPRSMSLTSLSTLATLDLTGPRRITDLATVEGVTQPSMTALVKALEVAGLIERQGDPTDGRVTLVTLTEPGSGLVQARRLAGAEAFEQLIGKLPADEAVALIAAIPALERLRALCETPVRHSDSLPVRAE